MPTTEKLRNKLMAKLTELFQLDQPDLDFGFYRIMHVKAQQIQSFIDKDLLKIIEDAFGQVDDAKKAELALAVEHAIQTAKDFGAPIPEETEPVKKAKAAFDALRSGATAEADVYDHLYRFFERYYDEGDFISRRYYAGENAGKAAPFAIPYNGEEVKLHWANADQYYIKTTEYFSNYSFDISQAAEIRNMSDEKKDIQGIPKKTIKVHFRIVDASEGEHGNVKATEDKKRFFVLYEQNPVEINDTGELVINFEYKALPRGKNDVDANTEKALKEKFGKTLNKGDMPNLAIAEKIVETVSESENAKEYLSALKLPAPTDKIANRPLLAKYINQYTARNTCDYFIHKDLSGFLKRELDFYIKNEVMHLDDIENADAPTVESYLAKLKVIRKIATKLIEFLAQLEDFQKKLWLKKKFITETNYCITLDRVPEELYGEIAANDAQREEWIKLFAIDEIKGNAGGLPGMGSPAYSMPLTIDFLKANDKLVLDTIFFSPDFKAKLIASIEDFDKQCDGLMIHSENFQALNLLQERYREQIQCVYIDPPYNTDASAIMYKNNYKNSSWISLIENRISVASRLMRNTGIVAFAIDDEQVGESRKILEAIFPKEIGVAVVRSNPQSRKTKGKFSPVHEYALFYGKTTSSVPSALGASDKKTARYPHSDEQGNYAWMNFIRTGNNDKRSDRPKLYYPIYVDKTDKLRVPDMAWSDENQAYLINEDPREGEIAVFPISETDGVVIEKNWHRGHVRFVAEQNEYRVRRDNSGKISIDFKTRMDADAMPTTWWDQKEYASANYGASELKELFGEKPFDFPKAKKLVQDCMKASDTRTEVSNVMDFFAGSGTSGQAIIELTRSDEGKYHYLLVEMGDHFDTVLKPRITKVIYSSNWKNGKPTNHNTGISHCFKYIRLESYEDTLNNLVFDENPIRNKTINSNPALKEDYILRYLLNVETRGSQSLLNIDGFSDPTAYTLTVKKPGSDEQVTQNIDLIETFNYLLGLRLEQMEAPQTFTADFIRKPDPELPQDQHTKLVIDGKIRTINNEQLSMNQNSHADHCSLSTDHCKTWWFRKLEGWVPADPRNPNNGQKERVLILWRKLTGNLEEDNLMLDEWFKKYRISTRDFEYDTIYVNGSNNLANLKKNDETWKVRLIEEEFHKKMWEVE